ncbi:MarR family winged helix-turn-helix transcriptional regulator [Azospirillum agricola]|uniref:MarR family winged helix-turn-helix transcriptional regulator n=1 Tax=Azospirillum agricola TaxID=1720247 RepID=UPI000A0F337A|nr:winged helix DNA-binding protein [Azospirillum agricola]SMH29398.1 DNA-binding transcriptional regulator, MarR family [Azospirillum lipoferum]
MAGPVTNSQRWDESSAEESGEGLDLADYHGLARLIERMHRRYLDVVRVSLLKQGIEDVGPVQALMIMLIGEDELSVRDLMERGYYLGSNASYSLKILVDAGYINRAANQRDRRTARLQLTDKGRALRVELTKLEQLQAEALVRNEAEVRDLKAAYRTLRRLDRVWGDMVRYSSLDFD